MARLALGLVLLAACAPAPRGDPALNVAELEDAAADWACSAPESCTADYLAFPAKADFGVAIGEAELERQLAELSNGTVQPIRTPMAAGALEENIVRALGVGPLRAGLDARFLEVLVVRSTRGEGFTERELLFVDPLVGTFKALLLLPDGKGPFPAVVALPGHGDSAAVYRDVFGGGLYPAHRLAVLMLTSRAMAIDADEHQVSHDLLRAGHTLMGLRTYEALLALKYLRWRPDIRDDRIGLIGHSGGSSTGNLLVRFEPGFAAYVSDHSVDYRSSGAGEPWHCETVPALYPLNELVDDFTTAPIPVKRVGYGNAEGMDPIFAFFEHYLGQP